MFVAFHNRPPLITMFFFSIFFQGAEVSSDEGLDKRDINVYRSHVKITGYNSHGHNSQVKCLETDTGANEIPTDSLHPLASNMQLPVPWHRLQRLPAWKFQGL